MLTRIKFGCIAIMFACIGLWLMRERLSASDLNKIEIVWPMGSLNQFHPKEVLLYYTTAEDDQLSERQVVRQPYHSEKMIFRMPQALTSLRFDVGFEDAVPDQIEKTEVSVRINGSDQRLSETGIFRLGNPQSLAINCPNLSYHEKVRWRVAPMLGVGVVLVGLCYFALIFYRGWFVPCFFLLCIVPGLRMNKAEISKEENRRLADFPTTPDPRAFEQAFNDRMFGRDPLMKLKSWFVDTLGGDDQNAKVLVGDDGWLYYKESLQDFANIKEWSPVELAAIGRYLSELSDYCQAHGKRFAFIICPDKCRVYPEYVAKYLKIRPDDESKTEKLVAYLRSHYTFPVIYPREYLLAFKKKSPRLLYYKKDTHWNWEGGLYGGFQPMMEAFGLPAKEFLTWKEIPNDAGDMFSMNAHSRDVPDCETYAKPDFHFELAGLQKDADFSNPEGGYSSIFMLRDSFCSAMTPFIYASFKTMHLRWRSSLLPEDRSAIEQSDYLVYEIVERRLPTLVSTAVWGPAIPWEGK